MGLRVSNPDRMFPLSILGCVIIICIHVEVGERRMARENVPFHLQALGGYFLGSFANPALQNATCP